MKKLQTLLQLFWTFFKIGLFTFGGGYAMIPFIEREVVEKQHWLDEDEVRNMIAIAESTPGPIAVNMATFAGHRTAGFWGSVFATLGLVLPSFLIIIAIAVWFSLFMENKWVQAAFMGIRAGVVAILVGVVIKLFKKMEKSLVAFAILLIGFFLATFIKIDIVFVILATGLFGLMWQVARRKAAAKNEDDCGTDSMEGE